MSIMNRALIEAAYVTYSTIFDMALKEVPTFYKRITQEFTGIGEVLKINWLGEIPKMVPWDGDRTISKLRADGFQLTTRWYANGLECDFDDLLMDSKTFNLIPSRVQALAKAAEWLKDELAALRMMGAFGATQGLAWDGQYFFDSDHTMISSGGGPVQSNLVSGALNSANFNTALQRGMEFKDVNGNPVGADFRLLVVGPANQLAARQLLLQEYGANGSSNIDFRYMDMAIWPRITNTMWWLQNTNVSSDGTLLMGVTVPAQFAMVTDDNSMEMFMRRKKLYGAHIRLGFQYGNWWNAIGSTGA